MADPILSCKHDASSDCVECLRATVVRLECELLEAQEQTTTYRDAALRAHARANAAATAIALEEAFDGWTGIITSESSTRHKRLMDALAASAAAKVERERVRR